MHHTELTNLPPLQMAIVGILMMMVLALYLLPTIVAVKRNSPHTLAVVLINFLFGFSGIGWIIALVLATKQPQPIVVVYGAPPPR